MKNQNILAQEQWQAFGEEDVFSGLNTSEKGLHQEEVKKRIAFYGENKLPESKKITLIKIILHQLLNPLIFILVAAAVASVAIGEGKDAIFIFLVIFINSALGTYQEFNAEKSANSLQKLMKIKARVRRSGKESEVPSEELVPGDIVFLESGVKVPADMRLLEVSGLEIDESFLTGESIVAKKQLAVLEENIGVAERTNMAFAGATVMKGRGIGAVVCTGIYTQVGKISEDVSGSASAKPPLVQRMEKFIRQISVFIVVLSVFLGIVLRMQGMDFTAIFFFVVALAVSAIPEGLPVALTVALSIATKRMAKRNVIVRKLTSVESLGSCTVIASDKTGTLTVNEQTAKIILLPNSSRYAIEGQGYNGEGRVVDSQGKTCEVSTKEEFGEITRIAVFANEASLTKEDNNWSCHGDAMDVALLGMSYKLGVNSEKWLTEEKPLGRIPYESERKFSASFYNVKNSVFIGAKGAVETILDFCTAMSVNGEFKELDKDKILTDADNLARGGYRVLAFASGEFKAYQKKEIYGNEDIPALTFHGLVGFIDPLRPEAKLAVEQCRGAGIKVIMITGDHPETAGTIARELGIADKNTPLVTGQMLAESGAQDSAAFEKLVVSTTVFARVSPTQKLEIVDVLIRGGEFVAVTGDGVNDAPALKRANIGVAMGSGTDVAKEVGSMIVVDDNFSSIVAGVEEGRFAFDNVRKVIYLLISTGAAEIILFLASIFAGLPLPLLAVQLLWLNLVTNGIQDVALAFEGGEPGAMKRSPRKPSEKIFNPLMINQTIVSGATMGVIVFGLWFYLNRFTQMDPVHSRDLILLLMVFMQNFHAFNCRSESVSAFKVPLKRNFILVFGVMVAQGIHILSMQIPFMQNILRIEPITFSEWLYILVLAIPIILVMEVFKYFRRKSTAS
ncbi:magnesium-transporting ATPase (P-type) [Algoriphagus sp. 4150]|uniref:cation-translocating P-type ATPase n=1 Tax=Algoriphagus sp. 4150 TaxID=2817756 RepID=UPI0028618384|nr:HAD-IC family P-type ATPase [Algoriphagus sp. 4150]MDR7127781.1 magnesium-transporting ATPase (P-type) [Algoriphagus sp. 4150]